MNTEIYTNENGVEIQVHFDDLEYQLLEVISYHDKVYECRGYDANGSTYSGIATISCDELASIEDIEQL